MRRRWKAYLTVLLIGMLAILCFHVGTRFGRLVTMMEATAHGWRLPKGGFYPAALVVSDDKHPVYIWSDRRWEWNAERDQKLLTGRQVDWHHPAIREWYYAHGYGGGYPPGYVVHPGEVSWWKTLRLFLEARLEGDSR